MTLSFSQKFRDGTPNHFIEKIWASLPADKLIRSDIYIPSPGRYYPKIHTLRAPRLWYMGQKIHFVVNNRQPNRYQFAETYYAHYVRDVEIVYDGADQQYLGIFISNLDVTKTRRFLHGEEELLQFARNDGFDSIEQFKAWFNKPQKLRMIGWTPYPYGPYYTPPLEPIPIN